MSNRQNSSFIKKISVVLLMGVMLSCVIFIPSCTKNNDALNTSNDDYNANNENADNENLHSNQARSRLTGKWINKNDADNVPFAVMYSNIKEAMPQSNIDKADIVFESLVEGGITRLCCLFENQTQLEKIGPVRSCRTYYLLFAKEFEAVYVHYGYSEYAKPYLDNSDFHSLDGMVFCSFYRSDDRVAPHNAYTSWDGIKESADKKNIPLTYPKNYSQPLSFNTDDTSDLIPSKEESMPCISFYPGYVYNKPWFEYDEAKKEYNRFQFGGPHINRETGQQLSYKNVLIKYVDRNYYSNGTPNYKVYGNGEGLYITDGVATKIKWKKEAEGNGPTKYYYADGSEVILNQGKTFICQVETTQEVKIIND